MRTQKEFVLVNSICLHPGTAAMSLHRRGQQALCCEPESATSISPLGAKSTSLGYSTAPTPTAFTNSPEVENTDSLSLKNSATTTWVPSGVNLHAQGLTRLILIPNARYVDITERKKRTTGRGTLQQQAITMATKAEAMTSPALPTTMRT